MDSIVFMLLLLAILGFCYFIIEKNAKTTTELLEVSNKSSVTVVEKLTTVEASFLKELATMEAKHWEQLEKQSGKQLQILEKQTKDFMEVMGNFIEATKQAKPADPIVQFLDKLPERENTIEKEEVEEQNLDEIPRIPLVDGLQIQMEGEEEVMPINIS